MKLGDYKLIFIALTLIGQFIILGSGLSTIFPVQDSDKFSELYLLDAEQSTENYPFNLTIGNNYALHVSVLNQMSSSVYYQLRANLRSTIDFQKQAGTGAPTVDQSLYVYKFLLYDEESWVNSVNFSILDFSLKENLTMNGTIPLDQSILTIGNISLNGRVISINSSSIWDLENSGFYFQLFFELWFYNTISESFEFTNQYVGFWFAVVE